MRITTLELLRYGRFADKVLDFPDSKCSFHLVVGQNEAGKTTVRNAITELLFGFEHNSSYGYRFENAQLRIGAKLENSDGNIYLRRRKGRAQTLLDRNEKPLPDSVLTAFLGQTNRDFFTRLFSLDQQGLVQGGRDVVEARNDLGRMLFQSAAGLGGLGEAIKRLDEQADLLWGPRASEKRQYTRAERRLAQADKDLKEATLRSPEYREATAKREEAIAAAKAEDSKASDLRAEENRLRRLQHALPRLAEHANLQLQVSALGTPKALPENAGTRLTDARSKLAAAEEAIRLVNSTIAAKESEVASLAIDENLAGQTEEIERLRDLRAQYRPYPADIEKREAEIGAYRKQAERSVKELGWQTAGSELHSIELPSRLARTKLLALAQQRGRLEEAVSRAKQAVAKQRSTNAEHEAELDGIPDAAAPMELGNAIAVARKLGDAESRLSSLRRTERAAHAERDDAVKALSPWSGEVDRLRELPVPPAVVLANLKARNDAVEGNLRRARDQETDRENELTAAKLRVTQIRRDENPVAAEELNAARAARDQTWHDLKQSVGRGNAEESRGKVPEFEASMGLVDNLTDRRYDRAAQSASLVRSLQEVERLEIELSAAQKRRRELVEEQSAVISDLDKLRQPLALPDAAVGEIETWLRLRATALDKARLAKEATAAIDTFVGDVERANELLRQSLGIAAKATKASSLEIFASLLQQAEKLVADHERHRQQKEAAGKQLDRGLKDIEAQEATLSQAEAELAKWLADWAEACQQVSLDNGLHPDQATTALDLIRALEDSIGAISDMQTNRIDAMKRDLRVFAEDVARLVQTIAPDLASQAPEEAMGALWSRLEAAQKSRTRRSALDKELSAERTKLQSATANKNSAMAIIQPLLEQAQVDDIPALSDAIAQSDKLRGLTQEVARIESELLEAGDGLSLPELFAESEGQDRDRIAARLLEIDGALRELGATRERIGREIEEAESRLRQMRGTDAASKAAEERQQALADMSDAVQRWTRLTVGVGLLRAAIDRYRETKQAPILKSAEAIFVKLTLQAFSALRIDYGQADHPVLLAIRSNGDEVPLEGLSTGTADQLFLALRIAAIEEYLSTADPLPFVVDDLFVNFDDERAAAGLAVLGELASRTQVIFLTHHAHLIGIADKALPHNATPIVL